MELTWDEWRGSLDGRPAMYIKRLARIPVWRKNGKTLTIRIDLHKFVRADDPETYHSHPAWAIRIPLLGGYAEMVARSWAGRGHPVLADRRYLLPLDIGIVPPGLCHRVASLLNGKVSYSLWIRGPVFGLTWMVGDGWDAVTLADGVSELGVRAPCWPIPTSSS